MKIDGGVFSTYDLVVVGIEVEDSSWDRRWVLVCLWVGHSRERTWLKLKEVSSKEQ